MALGQPGEGGEQALFDRGRVQTGEKHDQRATRGACQGSGAESSDVRFHELRFERSHRRDHGRQNFPCGATLDLRAGAAVMGQQVDAVMRRVSRER